jgi:hypothetical protein
MLKSKELKLAILFLFIVFAPYLFTTIAIQGSGNLDVNKIYTRAPIVLSPKDESKFIEDPYKYPVMNMGLSYSYIFFGLITYFFFWWYIEIKNLSKQKFDRYLIIPITIIFIFLISLIIYESI